MTVRTALVTGASAGIGREIAHVFARHGFDVILTARRIERLEVLAKDLADAHKVKTYVIAADLAAPEACKKLYGEIVAKGLVIDVLVNNAGYGVPGSYRSTDWQEQADFIQVLVTAVAEMTHYVLPGMIERGYGRILNVASVAGFLPGTIGHTLYPAAKAFVVRFSEALHLETRKTGVHVTALCPGFTYSEFHDITGTRAQVSRFPAFMWSHAERVAGEGYDAVMKNKPVHVVGAVYRALLAAGKLMPERLLLAISGRGGEKIHDTK